MRPGSPGIGFAASAGRIRLGSCSATVPAFRCSIAGLLGVSLLFPGCVSSNYRLARRGTLPANLVELAGEWPPVEIIVHSAIVNRGPGGGGQAWAANADRPRRRRRHP